MAAGRRKTRKPTRWRKSPSLARRLRRWAGKSVAVLGSGWSMLTAGVAAGIVVFALFAAERAPAPAPSGVAEVETAPAPPAAVAPVPAAAPSMPATAAPPATPALVPLPSPPTPAATPPASAGPQLAALPAPPPAAESGRPAWLTNAVAVPDPGPRPMIAIVIDDMGLNRRNSERATELPAPLTLAFLTYADDLAAQAAAARRAGHELLVHMPMQPLDDYTDPGPDVLETGAPPGQLMAQLRHNLAAFDGYVGINNHMGSRFTASEPDMRLVLTELKQRGLLFLDSRTIGATVGAGVAGQIGLPFAERDVFLDNVQSADAVEARLAEVERIARNRGYAIAIGHPHDATLAALAAWLPTLERRGFALVPVSAIVKRRLGVTG